MSRKKSDRPSPFLKGRKIQNERFTRHDSKGLAEDAIGLNIQFPEDIDESMDTVLAAMEALRKN